MNNKMGTKGSEISNEPFLSTFQVLERHKIRLPPTAYNQIPALAKAGKTVTAVAFPGHFGGIQISFGEEPLTKIRKRLIERARNSDASPERAGEKWTLLARFVASSWKVTFSYYDNRYTLVLPAAARDLNLVPRENEQAVVFIFGEIFEIWRPDAWVELRKRIAPDVRVLEEDLDEEPETKNTE